MALGWKRDGSGRRVPRAWVAGVAAAMLAGCGEAGPPTEFFVRGMFAESGPRTEHELKDALLWRAPDRDERYVLLSPRPLPKLADAAYAPLDTDVVLGWLDAPRTLLTLDGRGELRRYAMQGHGGSAADCATNPGQCSSAIAYVGDDAIAGGYGFGDEIDASFALPVRAVSQPVAPDSAGPNGVYDFSGDVRADDPETMYAVYTAIVAALARRDVGAFLAANGFGAEDVAAIAAMPGIDGAIERFATSCIAPARYEGFGDFATHASLLVYDEKDAYTPVYFRRRGASWILADCGRG